MANFKQFFTPATKKIILLCLITGFILFLVYLLFFARIWLTESTRYKTLLYKGGTVSLYAGQTIEQTFVSNYPGLSQIRLLVVNKVAPRQVNIYLKHQCNDVQNLASTSIDIPVAGTPLFYPVTFPPIDDSAGQTYCMVLETPNATTPEDGVQLLLSAGDLYPFGNVKINQPEPEYADKSALQPSDNNNLNLPNKVFLPIIYHPQDNVATTSLEDIGFLLHYNGQFLPMAQVFATRLTANKPYVWGQPWFYAGLVVAYGVLLVGLFRLAWKMQGRGEE